MGIITSLRPQDHVKYFIPIFIFMLLIFCYIANYKYGASITGCDSEGYCKKPGLRSLAANTQDTLRFSPVYKLSLPKSNDYDQQTKLLNKNESLVESVNTTSTTPSKQTQPPKTQPPKPQPPKTQPPEMHPLETQPPKTQPPKTQPLKTNPPETQPPKTQPPKTQPLKTHPPKTQLANTPVSNSQFEVPVESRGSYNAVQEMRSRAQEVSKRCAQWKKEGKLPPSPTGDKNQYIATMPNKHNVSYVYYPIAKCGWSTWMYVMFMNAGRETEPSQESFVWGWGSPYKHANMTKLTSISQTKSYQERLLFIRNPWDRLVSAYKNKALFGPYSLWFHTPCKWLKEGMPPLTFPQFAQCIVDAASRDPSSYITAKLLDIHWTPQYWSSLPCDTNYTLIGRFEHMSDDLNGAIKILKINSTLKQYNKGKKVVENESIVFWYKQLTIPIKEKLQKIYKMDFELFGFDSTIPS